MITSAFLGSKKLGLRVLETMHHIAGDGLVGVAALDDSKDERSCLDSFKQFCEKHKKPYCVVDNEKSLGQFIRKYRPDCCIISGYYRILKANTLNLFPAGCLGLHGSLLPKYRGGSPLVWAVINGDKESGISFFYFDEGMDTGDVVGQRKFKIKSEDTIADVLEKVEQLAIALIKKYFPLIQKGTAPRNPQDHSQATYVAMRKPKDGHIRWNWSASRIYDFIRAQTSPYPGAFCLLPDGQQLTIWSAKPFPFPYYGSPGQVVRVDGEGAVVTCGDGSAIALQSIQKPGFERQSPSEVLKFNQHLQ